MMETLVERFSQLDMPRRGISRRNTAFKPSVRRRVKKPEQLGAYNTVRQKAAKARQSIGLFTLARPKWAKRGTSGAGPVENTYEGPGLAMDSGSASVPAPAADDARTAVAETTVGATADGVKDMSLM